MGRYTVSARLWPGVVVPLLMFALLAGYPLLERRLTGDRRAHQLLQRPRDNPARTGLGAMAFAFYLVLSLSGATDVIAVGFTIPFERLVWAGRIAILFLPPPAYLLTAAICRRLQAHDRDLLRYGLHTGTLHERPDGVFLEVRQPAGGSTTMAARYQSSTTAPGSRRRSQQNHKMTSAATSKAWPHPGGRGQSVSGSQLKNHDTRRSLAPEITRPAPARAAIWSCRSGP
jgi:hypothetical protein